MNYPEAAYPYVDKLVLKRKLLDLYEVNDRSVQDDIFKASKSWFTNWSDFEFGVELDAKQSQEVY